MNVSEISMTLSMQFIIIFHKIAAKGRILSDESYTKYLAVCLLRI